MALITTEGRQELIALHVAMFNAAPGADRLSDMVQAVEGGATLFEVAAELAKEPMFAQVFPGLLTGTEFANRMADILLPASTISGARNWAVDWVTTQLAAGTPRSDIFAAAVQAIRINTNPDFNAAENQMANKVAVAEYYAVTKLQNSQNLPELQAVIANVTDDAATVDSGKADVDSDVSEEVTGQTFTLTSAINNLTGTFGNDTFIGDNTSANAGDTINGGGGTDTLKLYNTTNTGNLTSVEVIEFNALTAAGTVNTSAMSDVTSVALIDSDMTVAHTFTVGGSQAFMLKNVTDNGNAGNAVTIAGGSGTRSITVNGAGSTAPGGNDLNIDVSPTGISTLAINSTGTSSNLTIANTGGNIKTLSVSGDASLRVQAASAIGGTVTKLESTNSGGVTFSGTAGTATGYTVTTGAGNDSITLAQAAGANALSATTSVDLGAGNDTLAITNLTAAGNINGAAKFVGGEGTDTLNIANGAVLDATTGKLFSGFETLSLNGGTGTYDSAHLASTNTISSVAVTADLAGAVIVNNMPEAASLLIDATTTAALTVNQKDAGAGSPDDVMNVTVDTSPTAGRTVNSLDINDIETVNLASTGLATVTNTISTFSADEATKVTVNASTALTLSAVNMAALVLFDASASTKAVSITAADAYNANAGVAFKGGAAGDTINLTGATTASAGINFVVTGNGGADIITLPAGGNVDHVVYLAQGDSTTNDFDQISTFVTAEDKIDLKAFGFTGVATGAVLTHGGGGVSINASGDVEVTANAAVNFFNDAGVDRAVAEVVSGANLLVFVDVNKDGDFSAASDMVIQLTGLGAAGFDIGDVIFA